MLRNTAVTWQMIEVEGVVARLRVDGHDLSDDLLDIMTPPRRKRINPFGRHHFDLSRL